MSILRFLEIGMADVVEVAALESSTSGVRGLSSRVDKSGEIQTCDVCGMLDADRRRFWASFEKGIADELGMQRWIRGDFWGYWPQSEPMETRAHHN